MWHWELLLVIVLATAYLFWFGWPVVWSASENVRLVATFNTDEEAHVLLLREAIDKGFPRLGYIQYGYAYLNMGLLPLVLLSYIMDVTDQHIIVWLRLIPALFAIATIVLTFLMARRYFGRLAAWLSAFLLAFTVLNFLEMAVMSHSDIPQVFFMMLGIYYCCRLAEDGQLKWLLYASASAGIAFGCKYSGMFLLPVVGFYALLQTIRMDTAQVQVNSERVVKVGRIVLALAGVVLLVLGFLVIPYAAAPYADQEYFGVSIPRFLALFRSMAIAGGVGLAVLAALPFVWAFVRRKPKLAYLLKQGMLAAAVFALAFFVTSPFNVFSVRSGFVRGFLYESLHSGFGHQFEEAPNGLLWLNVLISPELLDPLIVGLAILSLVLTSYRVAKAGWQGLLQPAAVLWVWVLFYLIFLVWRVNIRTHRALLPIVPFLLMFAAHTVSQGLHFAAARLSRRTVVVLAAACLLIIAVLELPNSLDRMLAFRQSTVDREKMSDAVLAGRWLPEQYPPSTRFLVDPYSYVPPSFADVHVTPWGGTLQMLKALEPDVVIINDYNADMFSDIQNAATYARGEALYMRIYEYYAALRKQESGYLLIRDFGDVQVYARQ
jgi:hypothetical protein